jgi:hypothetical protein
MEMKKTLVLAALRSRGMGLSLALGLTVILCGASAAEAQISLGTAASFGVLGGSTVTNTGSSVIGGNLGVSPGTAVIGFPPGLVTSPGAIHSADAVAAQAQVDLTTAYTAIVGMPTLVDLSGTDLGGLTLTPGVYGFTSSAQLTGPLVLDALGNPQAVFIFKVGSALTTASGSSVLVINGGSSCNVFWQIGSSATLGTSSTLAGNILALTSITLTTGASVEGRILARNGAVTLDGNAISTCRAAPTTCPTIVLNPTTLPAGTVGAAYSLAVTASGGTAPYTYSRSAGTLPPGLLLGGATGAITGTPTAFGTYNFTVTATDANGCSGSRAYSIVIAAAGCPPIALSPATLPIASVGVPYRQVVSASGGTGPYTFSVSSGALPTGLTLDGATGLISGTPTVRSTFNFTIAATAANDCPGLLAYTMPVLVDSNAIPTLSGWGLMVLTALLGLVAVHVLRRAA